MILWRMLSIVYRSERVRPKKHNATVLGAAVSQLVAKSKRTTNVQHLAAVIRVLCGAHHVDSYATTVRSGT